TNKCLCSSRSRDSTVTRWLSLSRRAASRVPRKPVPPRMQTDKGFMTSADRDEECRGAPPDVEHQEIHALGGFAEGLDARYRRSADADDQIVRSEARHRGRAA